MAELHNRREQEEARAQIKLANSRLNFENHRYDEVNHPLNKDNRKQSSNRVVKNDPSTANVQKPDTTEFVLKMLSEMTHGRLEGAVIDDIRNIYMLAHGSNSERYEALKVLGEKALLMAATEGMGVAAAKIASALRNGIGVGTKFGIFWQVAKSAVIRTPYGKALQSGTEAAINARNAVDQGARLYRGGKLGYSAGPEGQFWSLENPLNPGYAEKYGLPIKNTRFDFVEVAVLKPGSRFITREAPGMSVNGGGGIEIVVNPGEPKLQYFHMPWEPEYDSVKQRFVSRN